MKGILFIALFFITLSSYFIYLSIKEWNYILKFDKNAIKTQGIIFEIYQFRKPSDETNTSIMKVLYKDDKNNEVVKDFICDLFERKVGDIVSVYYSKFDSNESMTDITNYPFFFIILSSIMFILGLILFIFNIN